MSLDTLVRCSALGTAVGLRSSWALAGPTLTGDTGAGTRLAAVLALAGETAADKHPSVPDRLGLVGLPPRLLAGAAAAFTLARRVHATPPLPIVAGVVGALAGAVAGTWWRSWAGKRMPDWQAALVEDAVAAALALGACRGTAG